MDRSATLPFRRRFAMMSEGGSGRSDHLDLLSTRDALAALLPSIVTACRTPLTSLLQVRVRRSGARAACRSTEPSR